jgi:hypothetical protein
MVMPSPLPLCGDPERRTWDCVGIGGLTITTVETLVPKAGPCLTTRSAGTRALASRYSAAAIMGTSLLLVAVVVVWVLLRHRAHELLLRYRARAAFLRQRAHALFRRRRLRAQLPGAVELAIQVTVTHTIISPPGSIDLGSVGPNSRAMSQTGGGESPVPIPPDSVSPAANSPRTSSSHRSSLDPQELFYRPPGSEAGGGA